MSDHIDIRSTDTNNPKLTDEGRIPMWRICVFKSARGRIIASASEGAYLAGPGFSSFRQDVFGCRRVEITLEGTRLTAKLKASGMEAVRRKLIEDGLATEEPMAIAA